MKVKSLLAQAAKCVTQEDAEKLLNTLIRVFRSHKSLSRLCPYNQEFDMEGDNHPFVHFELNHQISSAYTTMIRPEIRDGVLTVKVCTNRMLDNLGMSSRKREAVEGMDDLIEAEGERTINDVCKRAAELAIANHCSLMEGTGVPSPQAKIAAKKAW
jgi:hypothetical protein